MRVGVALRAIGVKLNGLKTCVDYNRSKFRTHTPGHIRSAQELANQFYRRPSANDLGAKSFTIYQNDVNANLAELKDRNGLIFIMNGWGSTDHIDVWKGNGAGGTLKGGELSYLSRGQQVWFWEFD